MNYLPKLYKIDSKNKVREWQVFYKDNYFYAVKGIKDGKLVEDKPTYCTSKNIGKQNETSPEEQALFEAKARWEKKVKQGYVQDVQDLHVETFYEPMLAKKYIEEKVRGGKKVKVKADVEYPTYCQAKLDGCRLIVKKDGAFSRTGERVDSVPHIEKQLKSFFMAFPDAILDGEIYNHDFKDNLNRIVSLYRKKKPVKRESQTDKAFAKKEQEFKKSLEESAELLNYHIYDMPRLGKPDPALGWDMMEINEDTNFVLRMDLLKQFLNPDNHDNIEIHQTFRADSEEEMEHMYEQFVNHGFEGLIIRADKPYENKRSKNLLKKKDFEDDEFVIVDVLEGIGNKAGIAATLSCLTNKKPAKEFDCNIRGDFEFCAGLLKNKKDYIGKKATVRFLKYSEYDKPIGNPVCTAINDDK